MGEPPASDNVFGEFINEESPIDTAKFPSISLEIEADIKVQMKQVSPPPTARIQKMAAAFNTRILREN